MDFEAIRLLPDSELLDYFSNSLCDIETLPDDIVKRYNNLIIGNSKGLFQNVINLMDNPADVETLAERKRVASIEEDEEQDDHRRRPFGDNDDDVASDLEEGDDISVEDAVRGRVASVVSKKFKVKPYGNSLIGHDGTPLADVFLANFEQKQYTFFVPEEYVHTYRTYGKFDTSLELGSSYAVLYHLFSQLCANPFTRLGLPTHYGSLNPVADQVLPPGVKPNPSKKAPVPDSFISNGNERPHVVFLVETVFIDNDSSTVSVPMGFTFGHCESNLNLIELGSKLPNWSQVIGYNFTVLPLNPAWDLRRAIASFIVLIEKNSSSHGGGRASSIQNAQDAQMNETMTQFLAHLKTKHSEIHLTRQSIAFSLSSYGSACKVACDSSNLFCDIFSSINAYRPADGEGLVSSNSLEATLSQISCNRIRAYAALKKVDKDMGITLDSMTVDKIKRGCELIWLPQQNNAFYTCTPDRRHVEATIHTFTVMPFCTHKPQVYEGIDMPFSSCLNNENGGEPLSLDALRRKLLEKTAMDEGGESSNATAITDEARMKFIVHQISRDNEKVATEFLNKIRQTRVAYYLAKQTLREHLNRLEHMEHLRKLIPSLKDGRDQPLNLLDYISYYLDSDDNQEKTKNLSEDLMVIVCTDNAFIEMLRGYAVPTLQKNFLFEDYIVELCDVLLDEERAYFKSTNIVITHAERIADDNKQTQSLQEICKETEEALNMAHREHNDWSQLQAENLLNALADPLRNGAGPPKLFVQWAKMKYGCAGKNPTDETWNNSVYFVPVLAPSQSFFQNYIQFLMIQVDRLLGRVNSHLPFIKSLFALTNAAVCKTGEERVAIYLQGDPGAGKTALLSLLEEVTCSYHADAHITPKSFATDAIFACMTRFISEIHKSQTGIGESEMNLIKEMMTSGELSVSSIAIDNGKSTRKTANLLAIHLTSWIAAGNIAWCTMPPEMRQRWFMTYVDTATQHPEAHVSIMKNDTVETDTEARANFIEAMKVDNFWASMLMLFEYCHIGNTEFNVSSVNRILADFDRGIREYSGNDSPIDTRIRKHIIRQIRHWSAFHAIRFYLGGPGGVLKGRSTQQLNLNWFIDMQHMYNNPSDEIIYFSLGLCSDNILDFRLADILTKMMEVSGVMKPVNFDDLTEVLPEANGKVVFLEDKNGLKNYNYQKVPSSYSSLLSACKTAMRNVRTENEIKQILGDVDLKYSRHDNDEDFHPIRNISVQTYDAKGKLMFTKDAHGKPTIRFTANLPPVKCRGRDCYLLVHLHNNTTEAIWQAGIKETYSTFASVRPYEIVSGRCYQPENSVAVWPNTWETFRMQTSKRCPVKVDPYQPDDRTMMTIYQHSDKETDFLRKRLAVPVLWKSEHSVLNSMEEFGSQTLYAMNTMSPEYFQQHKSLFYWENQTTIVKALFNENMNVAKKIAGGPDAVDMFSRYITLDKFFAKHTKPGQLPSISSWVVSCINKSAEAMRIATNQTIDDDATFQERKNIFDSYRNGEITKIISGAMPQRDDVLQGPSLDHAVALPAGESSRPSNAIPGASLAKVNAVPVTPARATAIMIRHNSMKKMRALNSMRKTTAMANRSAASTPLRTSGADGEFPKAPDSDDMANQGADSASLKTSAAGGEFPRVPNFDDMPNPGAASARLKTFGAGGEPPKAFNLDDMSVADSSFHYEQQRQHKRRLDDDNSEGNKRASTPDNTDGESGSSFLPALPVTPERKRQCDDDAPQPPKKVVGGILDEPARDSSQTRAGPKKTAEAVVKSMDPQCSHEGQSKGIRIAGSFVTPKKKVADAKKN